MRPELGVKSHQRPVIMDSMDYLKQVVGLSVFNFLYM